MAAIWIADRKAWVPRSKRMAIRRPLPGWVCLHAREAVFEFGEHVFDLVALFV